MSINKKKVGISQIVDERYEQIIKHKFSTEGDNEAYKKEELKSAAMYCLTLNEEFYPQSWDNWFRNKVELKKQRMTSDEFKSEMCRIAGAFLAAQIDVYNYLIENATETKN